jgi:hypothetical protein
VLQDGWKGEKQKSPSTFTTYSGPLWRQYPELLKKRYASYISKVEDRTTNCMVSPGFADRLMYHKGTFDSFCNQMRSAMDERCKAAYRGYYTFVREQREIMASLRKPKGMSDANFEYYQTMKWPGFSNKRIQEYFYVPALPTCIKFFDKIYEGIEPYLYQDLLCSRLPGQILRVDGTFNIMSKTMDLASTEEENNCQVKIHGEYNHIVSFAQCGAESNHVKERLLYFLREKMMRLGGQEAVDAVLAM